MRIITPHAEIVGDIDGNAILKAVESAGRVCYKSEDKITGISAAKFVDGIIRRGHEAVLEHASVTVRFVVDRGVSHEIVRHRLAAYCQESTRYCNYANEKFGQEVTFIRPFYLADKPDQMAAWRNAMLYAESSYFTLLELGASPQEARSVLPNSLKTEVVMTANLREWRHFFTLRTAGAAHPQMREVTIPLLREFQERIPIVFNDIRVLSEV